MQNIETPAYVFSLEKITSNYNIMKNLLRECEIYYALKANARIEVVSVLNKNNCKFEFASLGEFERLISCNVDVSESICALPIKKNELLNSTYAKGCRYYVFDSEDEYFKLLQYTPRAKKIMRIYVRDIVDNTNEFGMCRNEIEKFISEYPSGFDGITFHLWCNYKIKSMEVVLKRVEDILKKVQINREFVVNIGGGYRIEHFDEDAKIFDLNTFFNELSNILRNMKSKYGIKIYAEPGRGIINSAGEIITQIVHVRDFNRIKKVFIDAGKPIGLGASDITREIIPLFNLQNSKDEMTYDFYDITCLNERLFTFRSKLVLSVDDIIRIPNCGAYNICFMSDFHLWRKPMVILK